MVIPHMHRRCLYFVLALCAALVPAGCGGSSSAEPSTKAPTTLFPQGVRVGKLTLGKEGDFSLDIDFYEGDFSLPAAYTGALTLRTPILNEDGEATDATTTTEAKVSGQLRQTNETTPGRIVLFFDSSAADSLYGPLVIELPLSGAHDEQRTRSGVVDSTDGLYYYAAQTGARLKLNLADAPASITW